MTPKPPADTDTARPATRGAARPAARRREIGPAGRSNAGGPPVPSRLTLLVVVGSLMTMSAFATDVMLPAFPTMARDLGVTDAAIQQVLSVYMIGYALPHLLIGSLADRFGRRPVLLAGLGVYAAGSVVCLLAPNLGWLLAGRFVQGFGAAAGPILSRAVLRDLYSGRELGQMLSFAMLVFAAAPLLAPSVGALLLRFGQWPLMFVFLLGIAALLLALVLLVLPETVGRKDPRALDWAGIRRNARLVFSDPRSGWSVVMLALAYGTLMAYLTSAPALLIGYYGLSETGFALLFSLIASVSFFTQSLNARLLRRYSAPEILRVVLPLFAGVSLVMLAQVALGVSTLASVVANLVAFFACFSLTLANGTALALEPHRERAGLASGLMGFAQLAGGTLLGTVIGSFAPRGPLPLALGIALLAGFAWLAFAAVGRGLGPDPA